MSIIYRWLDIIYRLVGYATLHRKHRLWRERLYSSFVSKADEQVAHAWEILGDGAKKPRLSFGFSKITGTMLFSWQHEPSNHSSYLYRLGSKDFEDGFSLYNIDYQRRMGDLLFPKTAIAVAVVGLILDPELTQESFEKLNTRYQEILNSGTND